MQELKETEAPDTPAATAMDARQKIETIRTALGERSRKEEEEALVSHLSKRIRFLKARKEYLALSEETDAPATATPPLRRRRRTKRSAGAAVRRNPPAGAVQHSKPKKKQTLLQSVLPRRGDRVGEIVRKLVFWVSTLVFLGCVIWIITEFASRYTTQQKYDDISSQYHKQTTAAQSTETTRPSVTTTTAVSTEAAPVETEPEEPTLSLLPGADKLLELSDSVVGYITIPDTVVNYPVMQNRQDVEGDEFFLSHDFYGNDSHLGSIFLDSRCSLDHVGADQRRVEPNSDNLIVYGHDMLDESMFGSLRKYRNEDTYYDQHPLIYLNSNYQEYVFKIYGFFIADAADTTKTRFEYWNHIQFSGERDFYNYVNEVKRRTLRLTEVDVTYGDTLLTLSTCNGAFNTARLVVCARLVREGEDPYAGTAGSTPNPNIKWPTVYATWNEDTYAPDAPFVPYG